MRSPGEAAAAILAAGSAALLCGCGGDTGPRVTLISPAGGERWGAGSQAAIAWDATDVGRARVELSRDGGSTWETLYTTPVTPFGQTEFEEFTWTVDAGGLALPLLHCVVRVSDSGDPSVFVFRIGRVGDEGGIPEL